jgi:hypothetical protein
VRLLPELLTRTEVATSLPSFRKLPTSCTRHNKRSAARDVTLRSVSVRAAISQLLAHVVDRNGGDVAGSPNSVHVDVFRCSQH